MIYFILIVTHMYFTVGYFTGTDKCFVKSKSKQLINRSKMNVVSS